MKKRVVIAALAMCVALAGTACGAEKKEEGKTEDVQADAEPEQTGGSADEEDTSEVSEPEGFGSRLVSVDHVEKYIKIAEYKGLTLEKPETTVADEQIDDEIQYNLQNTMEEVTDAGAAAQDGDTVTINFVGTKDGIAFEGGSAENYDLTLGEGGMIDGFEDGIIGMKKGETKDLNLTFPENYFEESLAGEDVVFQITVQKIQRAPQLTDDWVAANSDVKTVDEYRKVIEAQLKEYAEREAEYSLQMSAWETVYTNSEVTEYPEADIQNAKDEFQTQVMQYADEDMTLEEFVESQGLTMEDFEAQSQQYAESKVKQNLIVQGIMDAEKLSLDDPECLDIQNMLISDYGVTDLAQLIDLYGQTAVDEAIGFLRVEQFLVDHATINEAVIDADADVPDAEVLDESEIIDEDDIEEIIDEYEIDEDDDVIDESGDDEEAVEYEEEPEDFADDGEE